MGSHLQVLYPLKIGDGGNNDSIVLYGRLLGLNFSLYRRFGKRRRSRIAKDLSQFKS